MACHRTSGRPLFDWLSVKVVACLLVACFPAAGAPEISVNPTSVGFGSVSDDRPVEYCFVISNRGDRVLFIDRITEDCGGCLSHSLETNTIPPGRSAILELALDTGVVEGSVAKRLVLHSNDPETPVLILSLWGTVAPGYAVRPRSVFFDALEKTSAITQVVYIAKNTSSIDPLSLVSSSTGVFSGKLVSGSDPVKYELSIGTVPPLAEGLTRGEVVLAGTNPAGPRCVIRVAAYVPPVFSVLPDRLQLRAIAEEQVKIIFVRQNSSKPAKLVDVVLPSQDFRCEINPGPGPADYRIYVRASGLAGKQGPLGGLVLKTDDPARAEVTVPIEVR
ncbi:MAG: DUF1573 domain-containing protein [bacterium]